MVIFHLGAIAPLFAFTWKAFLVAMFLWWIAGGIGIGMGHHRLLTHRGYRPRNGSGMFSLHAAPSLWRAARFSSSPSTACITRTPTKKAIRILLKTGLWSHVSWILTGRSIRNDSAILLPYVPDLRKDKFHVWISRWHSIPMTILGGLLVFLGGWSFLLHLLSNCPKSSLDLACQLGDTYVGFAAIFVGDTSRNNFWVALLPFGEGWHNNHHAHPQSARHGLAWYEFDPNWYGIWALQTIEPASNVKARTLKTTD